MLGLTRETRVFVKTGATDLRLSFEGLRNLVVNVIRQDLGVALAGTVLVQPEITAPGLGLAAAGGAIGIGAGFVQMSAGTLQGLGGGGYQNLWAGGMSLLGGAGLKWFVGPDRAWRTGSAMQRAKYDDLQSQATVVGGVYDALTNFADSLNPHPVFCSGLKQGR